MKKYSLILLFAFALAAVAAGVWLLPRGNDRHAQERTLISTALYSCDAGKTILAAYYEGKPAPQPPPGEPPVPTGSVDVSLDGGASFTLLQTISASGIRYANEDETFVFWSKGEEALIMRDNAMDLEYANCRAGSLPAR